MNRIATLVIVLIVCAGGCSKEYPDEPKHNQPPRTFLWLFPDSTTAEGQSSQHLRWWGDDPDGTISGFLFASGKIPSTDAAVLDTLSWHWCSLNDSVVAFPLLVKRDTFQVIVRAVDNTIGRRPHDHAIIRFVPRGLNPSQYNGPAFMDSNEDGVMDGNDLPLTALRGAMDPAGATLGFPVLNQPPTVSFAPDGNDPSVLMQQPETTFTVAAFSWVGQDRDGDQTITRYEIALNDTTNPSGIISLDGSITLMTLIAPRSRTDNLRGVQPVDADVWTGTYATTRKQLRRMPTLAGDSIDALPNLRLDTLNAFYVRARDIAGDVSRFIRMPADTAKHWFVKRPHGNLLLVADYISADGDSAAQFYRNALPQVGYPEFEVLNIGRYSAPQSQWATLKRTSHVGALVPSFIDPAFTNTLHLFDVVLWYTDPYPSLVVAQKSLYEYVRDPHHGKVLFTTIFETASDPRGALRDFAPLDSISSVNLGNGRLLPTMGESQIKAGAVLVPVSPTPYPPLMFNSRPSVHSVFMRPVYKHADGDYLYRMRPEDSRGRYAYLATLNDLRSISTTDASTAWVCGSNGGILHTTDGGIDWSFEQSGTLNSLAAIQFIDADSGWCVGDAGTILQTTNGGSAWVDRSIVTKENFLNAWRFPSGPRFVVGTNGLLIRSTNGGARWIATSLHTSRSLRSIHFTDLNTGVAVGDSGYIVRTNNGGATWTAVASGTNRRLNSVRYLNPSVVFAAGLSGTILRSNDSGATWSVRPSVSASEIMSIRFSDDGATGWACGTNGTVLRTQDGGTSWAAGSSGIAQPGGNAQSLTSVAFPSPNEGWCVGTGGMLLRSTDGGLSYSLQPNGDINVAVADGRGGDGHRSFVFLGLPLHDLNGTGYGSSLGVPFLQFVLHDEFGK